MWFGEPHPFPERGSPTILSTSGQQRYKGWWCKWWYWHFVTMDTINLPPTTAFWSESTTAWEIQRFNTMLRNQSLAHIPSHVIAVHILKLYLLKIPCNISIPFIPGFSQYSLQDFHRKFKSNVESTMQQKLYFRIPLLLAPEDAGSTRDHTHARSHMHMCTIAKILSHPIFQL